METTGQVNSGGKDQHRTDCKKQTEAGLSLHLWKDARVECVNSRRRSEGLQKTTATSQLHKDTSALSLYIYISLFRVKTKALIDLHMAGNQR